MKKLLWTLFVLLLLEVWFLALIKNPQSNISQKILPIIDNIKQNGVKGYIEFYRGDCMPCWCEDKECRGCPDRKKIPYNGYLIIIKQSIEESLIKSYYQNKLISGGIIILKDRIEKLTKSEYQNKLISLGKIISVKDGKYKTKLEPGDYIIHFLLNNETNGFSIDDLPYNHSRLSISKREIVEKNISFTECAY